MCLIYKTSQDFHDNSVHMYILRLRNYPVEIFVNNNNNNNNEELKKNYHEDSDKGYSLEVDVECLKNLNNLQSDLSFLPKRMKVKK